jgi:hypothetical protein
VAEFVKADGNAIVPVEPEAGAVALSLSNSCAPTNSVKVELSTLQNTLNEVGLVPLPLSIAAQAKLKSPAVRPVKSSKRSTATASGVALDPVERNTMVWFPF